MIDCTKTKQYFSEKRRMIRKHGYVCKLNCGDCPLNWSKNGKDVSCEILERSYPEQAISIVQKWSAEHPQRTYFTEFLRSYPNTPLSSDGTPDICPHCLGLHDIEGCKKNRTCIECWNQPVPEDGEDNV